MDYIGSEISHKIRSAIKAKLMELGAYVDEELPEYIMVMVANKRAKAQMDGDLQLFLGSNTSQFTSWLYQVLQKLQEVTIGNLDKKSTKTTSSSVVNDVGTAKRKSSTSTENDSHRKEKRRKSSESRKSKKCDVEKSKESKKDSDSLTRPLSKGSDIDKVPRPHVAKDFVNLSRLDTSDSVVSSSADGRLSRKVHVKEKERHEKVQEVGITKRIGTKSSLSNGSSRVDEKNYLSRLRAEALRSRDERISALKDVEDLKWVVSGKQQNETKSFPTKSIYPQGSRAKIVLMNSDDEDDDEDFINIKADAEAEQLLKEELPRDVLETSVSTPEAFPLAAVEAAAGRKRSPEGPICPPDLLPTIPLKDLVPRRPLPLKESALSPDAAPAAASGLSSVPAEFSAAPVRLIRKRVVDAQPESVQVKFVAKDVERAVVAGLSNVKCRLGIKKEVAAPAQKKEEEETRTVMRIGFRTTGTVVASQKADTLQMDVDEDKELTKTTLLSTGGGNAGLSSRVVMLRERNRPVRQERAPEGRLLSGTKGGAGGAPAQEEEEEEYDPSNPAVGTVASVVRVKPRPKVPAALQANKTLILKAVAEAQKSVASRPARVEATRLQSSVWKRTGSGFVRKHENNVAVRVPARHFSFDDTEDALDEDIKHDSTRFVSAVNNNNKIVIKVSSSKPSSAHDGSDEMELLHSGADEVSDDDGPGTADTGAMGRSVCPPVGLASRVPLDSASSQSHHLSSPQFLVTLDGLDPNIFGPRTALSLKDDDDIMEGTDSSPPSRASSKKAKTPIVYKMDVSDDASEPSTLPKSLERCKYWPSCRQGTKCSFHHPVSPCKSFPKCSAGDKCLYIHPFCKFNSACTRRDCTFVHAAPRTMVAPASRPVAVAKQTFTALCRYFPKCSNAGCRFLHPKACRYGKFCSKQDCNYIHPDIPSMDKLKWTSPFKT